MAGYYDEIAGIMAPATSPGGDDEEQEEGTSTLQSAGAGSGTGTGRYSENGNELPKGLYTRNNPSNLPDSPLPSPQQSTPPSIPVASASPNVSNESANTLNTYADQGYEGQVRNLRTGDRAVQDLAGLPDENKVLEPLTERLNAAQQPVNPMQHGYNPNLPQGPGNMPGQENYRPSVGSRILRGVKGFMRGGVVGALDPRAVGVESYGAPNDNFKREVSRRAALAKNAADLIKIGQDAYTKRMTQDKDVQTGAQSQAQGWGRLPTQVTNAKNAETSASQAATAAERLKQTSPEGKAAATRAEADAKVASNIATADKLGLKGDKREQYILNGRVNFATPRVATEGERANSQALAAFKKEHGRGPQTLAEYADIAAAARGAENPEQRLSGRGRSQNLRAIHEQLTTANKDISNAQNALNKTFKKEDRAAAQKRLDDATAKRDEVLGKLDSLANESDTDDAQGNPAPSGPSPNVPKPPPAVAGDAVPPPPNAEKKVLAKDGTLLGYTIKGQKGYTPLSKLKKKS